MTIVEHRQQGWREFIEGELYADDQVPWRDDPAYAQLLHVPGLRESIGGHLAPALHQAIGLVQALTQVDLLTVVRAHRPAWGLCLGFGMNLLEPFELLRVFALDSVHAYEWIREHVVEAAQALQALRVQEHLSLSSIRLHHGTISDLSAVADGSIAVIYTGNVFQPEIPMSALTFAATVKEIVRVLATNGIVVSRGSSGDLEAALSAYGHMLLQIPLVSVVQKR